jgi:peptide/nickel transport system ATP-binding protein
MPKQRDAASGHLLDVRSLHVEFETDVGPVRAVDNVSFTVASGRTVAIVGESGCGKSSLCAALGGLLGRRARVRGQVLFEGRDLLALDKRQLRSVRGRDFAMVFQDPLDSLNPVMTVGAQLVEAISVHDRHVERSAARERAAELLATVGISRPRGRLNEYPHQLSGGMRQRVLIAMALANRPRLVIADEPTTALDVTTQAQIIALIQRLRAELGMTLIIVTHDLGLVAELADDVLVMYAGRIVEAGSILQVLGAPEHPYTWALISAVIELEARRERLTLIGGAPPSLLHLPGGCRFHPRCPYVMDVCRSVDPQLDPVLGEVDHLQACHLDPLHRRAEGARVVRGGNM